MLNIATIINTFYSVKASIQFNVQPQCGHLHLIKLDTFIAMYVAERKLNVNILMLFLRSFMEQTKSLVLPSFLTEVFEVFHADIGAKEGKFCKKEFTKTTHVRMFPPEDHSMNFLPEGEKGTC